MICADCSCDLCSGEHNTVLLSAISPVVIQTSALAGSKRGQSWMQGCLQGLLGGPEHQPASTAPSAWCGSACLAPFGPMVPASSALSSAAEEMYHSKQLLQDLTGRPETSACVLQPHSAVQTREGTASSLIARTSCHCSSCKGCMKRWPTQGKHCSAALCRTFFTLQSPGPAAGAHGGSSHGGDRAHL